MDSMLLRSPIKLLDPPEPICVSQDKLIRDVIKTMRDRRIGCVCVVDEHEKLVGIFSERDVLTRVVGKRVDTGRTRLKEVMTPNPEYLYFDDKIAFALNRMHVGGFRHIPLVDLNGRPAGVISVKDIVAHLVKRLEETNS